MNPNPSEYPSYVKYLREQFNELHKEYEKTLKRAEAAEARVKELEQDNARGAAYVQHLTASIRDVRDTLNKVS